MRILLLIITFLLFSVTIIAQEKLEVEGALRIGASEDPTPSEGTIRYNTVTNDFEGWNGTHWFLLTAGQYGEVRDFEGQVYKTIKIGTQEWMAENLSTRRHSSAVLITLKEDNGEWASTNSGAYCLYNNDSENEIPYGKLYNWYAVNDPRGLCPTGWHVPSDTDWKRLTDYLGGTSIAGGRMKEDIVYWHSPNLYASNESGFSGFPGGSRANNGTFKSNGSVGSWWSSTQSNASDAWIRDLVYNVGSVFRPSCNKNDGFSVRCLKD